MLEICWGLDCMLEKSVSVTHPSPYSTHDTALSRLSPPQWHKCKHLDHASDRSSQSKPERERNDILRQNVLKTKTTITHTITHIQWEIFNAWKFSCVCIWANMKILFRANVKTNRSICITVIKCKICLYFDIKFLTLRLFIALSIPRNRKHSIGAVQNEHTAHDTAPTPLRQTWVFEWQDVKFSLGVEVGHWAVFPLHMPWRAHSDSSLHFTLLDLKLHSDVQHGPWLGLQEISTRKNECFIALNEIGVNVLTNYC